MRTLAVVLGTSLVLAACLSVACNVGRSYSDWVWREPVAARFGSPEPVQPLALAAPVLVGTVRGSETLSSVAGDISGMPDPIPVPFHDETPPVVVLRADLERMLSPTNPASAGEPTPFLRLDATLVQAYVRRTYHVFKSSEMQARVVLDLALFDLRSEQELWAERILAEHALRPAYVTSEAVEEALNAAYAQALAQLGSALVSVVATRANP